MSSRVWQMAETVYLNDGSVEVVFTDKQTFLNRLIQERLGNDAARFFRGCISDLNERIKDYQRSVRDKEMAADGYYRMCHDAMEQFQKIDIMLNAPRLDKAKLKAAVREGYDCLYRNL